MGVVALEGLDDRFPAGTSVAAYEASDFPIGWTAADGLPGGLSAAGTETVDSDGSLEITGLTIGTRYRLVGTVAAVLRSITVSPRDDVYAQEIAAIEDATEARTIYVSPEGTGDGLSSGSRTTPDEALEMLSVQGLVLEGDWTIDMAAGTYPSITVPGSLEIAGYLVLRGADVGGHPNVPTTIIDAAHDDSGSRGIAANHTNLWVRDILTKDFSNAGVSVQNQCKVKYWNHHDDGSSSSRQHYSHVRHNHAGGILKPTTYGVEETFGCIRDSKGEVPAYVEDLTGVSYSNENYAALIPYGTQIDGTAGGGGISTGDVTGWYAKENCVGHFDFVTITDCAYGVVMLHWSAGNVRFLTLERNYYALWARNGEFHQESDVFFGSGADENTHHIFLDNWSVASDRYGSGVENNRLGQPPPLAIDLDHTEATAANITAPTVLRTFTVPAKLASVRGQRIAVRSGGTFPDATGSGTVTLALKLGGVTLCSHSFDTLDVASNERWRGEWVLERAHTVSETEHLASGRLELDGLPVSFDFNSVDIDLTVDQDLELVATMPNVANSIEHAWWEVAA